MNDNPSLSRRLVLCVCGALLVVLSFPNFLDKSLTPFTAFLGWVALIPFFISLRQARPKTGALLGFVFGFTHLGGILYWIAFLEEAKYLSGLAWFVLVFYLSLYFMLFGWGYCYLTSRLKISGVWIAPFLWVALEYIRGSRPWGGFNWGEIGYCQAPYPSILVFTSFAGVYGLTFLMVWFNAYLAGLVNSARNTPLSLETVFPDSKGPELKKILLPLGVLLGLLIFGTFIIKTTLIKKVGTVALLQPSIDQSVKWSKSNEEKTYQKIGALVKQANRARPDLYIWPETGAPAYLLSSPIALGRVVSIVRQSKASHLVGCLDTQRGKDKAIRFYNAAVQFNSAGRSEGVYHKRHLVPFGEFVPFQKYLTFLGPVVGDLGNFDFGLEYQKFKTVGFSYTPMICYEVIFPGDVQKAFKTGADALVNISNDAWYGRTASAYQHVMMAVVRAAEERKPLLRAANTGISLATDPFGRILNSTQLFDEKVLLADVMSASSGPTLYSRFGNWLPWFCWLMVVFFGWMAIRKVETNTNEVQ